MKNFFEAISSPIENGFWSEYKDKFSNAINKHPEIFCLSLLGLCCLIFLFTGLNSYPLIDVDETRYAVIARDLVNSFNWNNLNLNTVPFLEKPPLYFWLVGGSIKLFGSFSGFAVRFPIALLSAFIVFYTYFFGKKVLSRKYGMISALTLLSSLFFLILAHIAILDMVLTVFVTAAIYTSFLTHFCLEKNKKYLWWYFYVFIGLGFLAKGILAFVIPIGIIFIYNLITKSLKDIFKPVNILPGLIIFLLIATPWHAIMYKEYGYRFVYEYFLVHHFARFINSEYIGRERPFYYFIPVFLLGFFPWTFVFLAFVTDGIKKIVGKFKTTEGKLKEKICSLFETTTSEQKLLLFTSIYFIFVFGLFSSSSTKLPTYILPVFPAAALLTGYYWWSADEKGEHKKSIKVTTILLAAFFIIAAMGASIAYYFLPMNLQDQIGVFKHITILTLYLLGILLLLRLNAKRALSVFSGYIVTMLFIIILSVSQIFNLVYAGGENEIVKYSDLAQTTNTSLITFDFAVKPSALINYTEPVNFVTDPDFHLLDRILASSTKPTFVIIKNKNMKDNPEYVRNINKRLTLLKQGEKYSLYYKNIKNRNKFNNTYLFAYLINMEPNRENMLIAPKY